MVEQILRAEEALTAARVPPCFWVYVSANKDPAHEPNLDDRLGSWGHSRAWAMQDTAKYPSLFRTVVDGRDSARIETIVRASWGGWNVFKKVNGKMTGCTREDSMDWWHKWLAKAMDESSN